MRHLTKSEVERLEISQKCSAEDWSKVTVSETFDVSQLDEVAFIGECRIGDLSGMHIDRYGIPRRNGIRRAVLRDTVVGDGAYIVNIRDCISSYDIGSEVTITNTDAIIMTGRSTFGNGVMVPVLNETGGINVPLSRRLTAQIAYLLVTIPRDDSRHKALLRLIEKDTESASSDRGIIGDKSCIVNCGTITDGFIGEGSVIDGALRLSDFSLCSQPDYPAVIGTGVIGDHFIALAGASLLDGCTVHHAFVGQSARITDLFSLNESLIFSNCTLARGEASAIIAGPFTVSAHKSSLLIAGFFSFLNAGSGSNQSNHLYKTGPIHHGLVERGSKTSSDSYILWPSRIGPFSLIMGRHTDHVDTSAFPFSYVIENHNETYLVPGRALLTIGTMRDAKKWPSRDHRPTGSKMDCINYNLLSPYTVGKMEEGYHKLNELLDFIGKHDETYIYHNLHIRSSALHHGIEIYGLGIDKFIGNSLITRIRDKVGQETVWSIDQLRSILLPDHLDGEGEWVDLCGMIAPHQMIESLLERLVRREYATIDELSRDVRAVHERYYELEWDWSFSLLCRRYHISGVAEVTYELLEKILRHWIDAVLSIDDSLIKDAAKEYAIAARVSLSGSLQQVRPEDVEKDTYVLCVREHIARKRALYDSVTKQLGL